MQVWPPLSSVRRRAPSPSGQAWRRKGSPWNAARRPRKSNRASGRGVNSPASHVACAESLLVAYADLVDPVLGLDAAPGDWVLVTTASFEFVRPAKDDGDPRPVFEPGVLAVVS